MQMVGLLRREWMMVAGWVECARVYIALIEVIIFGIVVTGGRIDRCAIVVQFGGGARAEGATTGLLGFLTCCVGNVSLINVGNVLGKFCASSIITTFR